MQTKECSTCISYLFVAFCWFIVPHMRFILRVIQACIVKYNKKVAPTIFHLPSSQVSWGFPNDPSPPPPSPAHPPQGEMSTSLY